MALIGLVRVSTDAQDTRRQHDVLEAEAHRAARGARRHEKTGVHERVHARDRQLEQQRDLFCGVAFHRGRRRRRRSRHDANGRLSGTRGVLSCAYLLF